MLFVAMGTTWLISKKTGIRPAETKFTTIDGLRGYLAFFVFLHHAFIWRVFVNDHLWVEPVHNVYNHFGKTSVAIFFMITGFLFFNKLIENSKKPIDWLHLMVSRFTRLVPLYFTTVFLILLLIGFRYGFYLKEPLSELVREIAQWAGFTIFGSPAINRTPDMGFMVAGVTWSLVYEWLFYFTLPLAGLIFFRSRVPVVLVLVSIVMVCLIYTNNNISNLNLSTFGAGILSAFLIRVPQLVRLAKTPVASVMAISSLFCSIWFFHSFSNYVSVVLTLFTFYIIACGNSIWGLLNWPVSRLLGQISYGIYILHGLMLYVLLKVIIGMDNMQNFSVHTYWLMMAGVTIIFISICYLAHYFIELPGIRATKKITDRISRLVSFGKRAK